MLRSAAFLWAALGSRLRQHYPEFRAAPFQIFRGGEHDDTTIAAYEIGRDDEAEAGPAGAAGTEWGKELRSRADRNAGSRIADFDLDLSIVKPALDPDSPRSFGLHSGAIHRLDPVANQIHEDTKHLFPVRDDF